LNIEKLDGSIVQKHGGSKQVGLKQLGSKQVGFKQLGHKQVGFKQLGPGVETGVHRVQVEKRVWFEVELQGAQGDRKAKVFQVSNNDAAVAQRRLEDKQPEEKINTNSLVKEQEKVHLGIRVGANITVTGVPGQEGAEGNVAKKKKVKESIKANLRKLLKYNAWSTCWNLESGTTLSNFGSNVSWVQLASLSKENHAFLWRHFEKHIISDLKLSGFPAVIGINFLSAPGYPHPFFDCRDLVSCLLDDVESHKLSVSYFQPINWRPTLSPYKATNGTHLMLV
ncbi:hypothetical protein Tco_1169307, partial [Tanacetum coccineum]